MARFGREAEDRGDLDIRESEQGVIQGFFLPRIVPRPESDATRRLADGVMLFEAKPAIDQLAIYPTNTLPQTDGFLGPKYKQVTTIIIPTDIGFDWDAASCFEELPSGFTKDYGYGLGLAKEYEVIIDLIEESTNCTVIEFISSGDLSATEQTFRVSFSRFDSLRKELNCITSRGRNAILRVKKKQVRDNLAEVLGLEPQPLSLGQLPTSKWMTQVAAGEEPLNDEEQGELLAVATARAPQIAASNPRELACFQAKIQLVNLNQLIEAFGQALGESHPESWWQRFFEWNVFVLQLIFGGPTVFVDSQVHIGDANTVKGLKIADYLFKNAMTGNVALVEIKKPTTQLLRKTPYRAGVYGIHSEIGQSVTQVLDQALHLANSENDTKQRIVDKSWSVSAPRCFVVAGSASVLDTDEKRKSFELYREHLAGVRLVTFDEIFEQLMLLRDFLAVEDPE
jgi:hypothetical protein